MSSFSISNTVVDKNHIAPISVDPIYNANKLQDFLITDDAIPSDDQVLVYNTITQEYEYDTYITESDVLKNNTVSAWVTDTTRYGRDIKNTLVHAQQQKIQSSDIAAGDLFGHSVALSADGQYAVCGAYNQDTGGTNAGAVYVFKRSGNTWTQQQKLQSSDIVVNDVFGQSVDISANGMYIICGAPGKDSVSGAAYIFIRSEDTWTQQQKIQSSDIANNDFFARRVSISADGTYIICGAKGVDTGGTNAGAAYIFIRSDTTWTQQQKIQSSDIAAGDSFGDSVAISENGLYAICGAPLQDTGGTSAGAAYVFLRTGTVWTQQQKIQSSDVTTGDTFGSTVTISSDGLYAACGAITQDTGVSNAGAVYVFTRSGTTWTQQQKIQSSDVAPDDGFGTSLTISSDGQYLVSGVLLQDTGGSAAGAVYVYTRAGTTWSQQQKIQSSDKAAGDAFGTSVAVSSDGQYLICGTPGQDTGGADAGAAYIFKTDNYIPLKTTGITVDSTTDTTKTMGLFDNVLLKTGNTSNAGYTITLPPNMVDGRIITVFMTNADTTGVTFSPAVLGHTNPTNLGANGKIQMIYSAATNAWYKIA